MSSPNVRIMCLHIHMLTHYRPYLVGRQEVLAGRTAGHNSTGSHTKMRERKREICEVGLVHRQRAGRAQIALAVCVYCTPCHMLHGKFHPETHCCWGVECWSHWRGFPSPPMCSLIPPALHLLSISYALKNKSFFSQSLDSQHWIVSLSRGIFRSAGYLRLLYLFLWSPTAKT